MSVIVHDGIGYGVNTHAAFYTDDGRAISKPAPLTTYNTTALWVPWGDSNDEPALIADDIENCPVLSAGVEAEARFAVGKGPEPYLVVDKDKDGNETLEWVDDPDILDFLELNSFFEYSYRNVYNMLGYGWAASQIVLNQGRNRINRVFATDVYNARLAKKDLATGNIADMYLCSDWSQAPAAYDTNKMKRVPLLYEGYEQQQLEKSISGFEFGMLHRLLRNGAQYYPKPMHRSAKAWVKISRSIPRIKDAINQNQMTIKYLVIIAQTYWDRIHKNWNNYTAEKKQEIIDEKYDEINKWLTGELNAGKTLIAGRYYDQHAEQYVDDITITAIDDKLKDGKMLPDSAAADKQILFSMMFNPAIWGGNLLGDGASGGAGSGSDIREAALVLLSLLHPERMKNLAVLNMVKNFNGWSNRLEVARPAVFAVTNNATSTITQKKIIPRLVFRYGNAVLTTLDTGKSQKQTNN